MGNSGFIIAFVVALWAAYFVPLVLRRYDEASKNSGLETEGPLREVVTPVTHSDRRTTQDAVASTPSSAAPQRISRAAERVAARRRRNTLMVLVGLLVAISALSISHVLPVWMPALPVALIAAWLVACRMMVRSERGLSRPRVGQALPDADAPVASNAAKAPTGEGKTRRSWSLPSLPKFPKRDVATRPAQRIRAASPDEEATVVVSDQYEDIAENQPHVMENVPLEASALDEQLQIAVPSAAVSTGEALWDPLPVTVPTYVTKPRVGRTVRTIDFAQPDAWTSGHVEGEQIDAPARTQSGSEDVSPQRRDVG